MDEFNNDLLNTDNSFEIDSTKNILSYNMKRNHYHNHYEVYYQMAGDRYYFIEDRTYFIKKGDLVIIDLNVIHKTMHGGSETYEKVLVNFKEEYISDILEQNKSVDLLSIFRTGIYVLRLNANEQNIVESILSKMLYEKKNLLEGYDLHLKILLIELLFFIKRYMETYSGKQLEYPNQIHRKISEITRYINNNYEKQITLKFISKYFYITPYYLSRTFKKVTGFTFIEYLNNVRIKESQKLLTGTNLSITEISEKVGFLSQTSFGRVFKSINHVSPLQFRKRNKI